ncbi:hypothetical protein, partial [Yoonia sp. R2-816]|uniref:hypothetical protein n=1 Tax=Yoonia sp. R2-816 TaxID=3342638 RepID=UPI00372B3B87
ANTPVESENDRLQSPHQRTRGSLRSNRQHTFPIDTANPRGFHPERFSNAGHPYGQAETSRHGPHQKIFIAADI